MRKLHKKTQPTVWGLRVRRLYGIGSVVAGGLAAMEMPEAPTLPDLSVDEERVFGGGGTAPLRRVTADGRRVVGALGGSAAGRCAPDADDDRRRPTAEPLRCATPDGRRGCRPLGAARELGPKIGA